MPPTKAALVRALEAYDAGDAAAVTARVRQDCDIAAGAARLEAIYQSVLAEAAATSTDRGSESLALARYLEENFQHSRLYHGEFARRVFTPTPESELHATVRKLDMAAEHLSGAIDELAYQTRSLSRSGIGSFFAYVLQAALKRWRLWRAEPIHYRGDSEAG